MKSISFAKSSLVVLSLLLSVAGAHAQSAAQAKVPFAFKVGTAQLPAGTYTLKSETRTNLVMVRNVQTGAAAIIMARRQAPSSKTDKLIFHRYGSQYYLSAILGGYGSDGLSLPAPKQQKQTEAANAPVDRGNTVEIASK